MLRGSRREADGDADPAEHHDARAACGPAQVTGHGPCPSGCHWRVDVRQRGGAAAAETPSEEEGRDVEDACRTDVDGECEEEGKGWCWAR